MCTYVVWFQLSTTGLLPCVIVDLLKGLLAYYIFKIQNYFFYIRRGDPTIRLKKRE